LQLGNTAARPLHARAWVEPCSITKSKSGISGFGHSAQEPGHQAQRKRAPQCHATPDQGQSGLLSITDRVVSCTPPNPSQGATAGQSIMQILAATSSNLICREEGLPRFKIHMKSSIDKTTESVAHRESERIGMETSACNLGMLQVQFRDFIT
jgi:hypothetical protein